MHHSHAAAPPPCSTAAAVPRGWGPLLHHSTRNSIGSTPVAAAAASKRGQGGRGVDAALDELQQLAAGSSGGAQQQRRVHSAATTRLLARVAPAISSGMSTGQLCRLAFVLSRLQATANVRPLWQAVFRTLARQPAAGALAGSGSGSGAGSGLLAARLQQQASPGEVLYVLRALAAWKEADDLQAPTTADAAPTGAGDGSPPAVSVLDAVVLVASNRADSMTLQQLLLSAVCLAQLKYTNKHLQQAAACSFVAAVAAGVPAGHAAESAPVPAGAAAPPPTPAPAPAGCVLPGVTDVRLAVNFLAANASLAHVDSQLLPAALQLLLQQGLVETLPGSHVGLCMWSLAALAVVGHLREWPQDAAAPGAATAANQPELQQQQLQELQQLTAAVHAVHHRLADRALQLVMLAEAPPGGVFGRNSCRQMDQARVWLQAAACRQQQHQQQHQQQQHQQQQQQLVSVSLQQPAAAGLWSLQRLCQAASSQQGTPPGVQQRPSAAEGALWRDCAAAWLHRPQVSRLQKQVAEALQSLGCRCVCLEFPARPLWNSSSSDVAAAETASVVSQLQAASTNGVADLHTDTATPCMITLDVVCLMPRTLLSAAQARGLVSCIRCQQQQQQQPGGPDSGGFLEDEFVLVAVEVDGPTHATVNDMHHELGATVCRDWLLRQWGWTLLKVAWWEWQQHA